MDKIVADKFQGLSISEKKVRLQSWRDLLLDFVITLSGDTIQVPDIWEAVKPLKHRRGGIDTELDLSDFTKIIRVN